MILSTWKVLGLGLLIVAPGCAALQTDSKPQSYPGVIQSTLAFNTGQAKKTGASVENGTQVRYDIKVADGYLKGCNLTMVEELYSRDKGAWGIFDVDGTIACTDGGFSYVSSGTWDKAGFHASGDIKRGSGHGKYRGISGRVAHTNGTGKAVANNTFDFKYDLVFDTTTRR